MNTDAFDAGLRLIEQVGALYASSTDLVNPLITALRDDVLAARTEVPVFTALRVRLDAETLADALKHRSGYHAKKYADYATQADALRQKKVEQDMAYQTQNPVQQLEQQGRTHEQRAAFFAFMAEHLDRSGQYQLSEPDLLKLELLDRYL